MVDVSGKPATKRTAVARSMVQMEPATAAAIADQSLGKGDVLAVARVAGIQAAKKTSELIPLCHPLALSAVKVEFALSESDLEITATVETVGPTGVEMEALTAVSVAALTIYDMCKAIDRGMTISNTQLLHKAGGKSGDWSRA
jgi:cyclic pyranopterin phosphate synthase